MSMTRWRLEAAITVLCAVFIISVSEGEFDALASSFNRRKSRRKRGRKWKPKQMPSWLITVIRLFVKLRARALALLTVVAVVLLFSVKRETVPVSADFDDNGETESEVFFVIQDSKTSQQLEDDSPAESITARRPMRSLCLVNGSAIPLNQSATCLSNRYLGHHGPYNVLYNYVPAEQRFDGNQSITFCTHATYHLLPHVEIVCRRWRGPVSIAVFAPGSDFEGAVHVISLLRTCGHACVKSLVSFHMIYNKIHPPSNESRISPYVDVPIRNCQTFASPVLRPPKDSFKTRLSLTYPINVARNVARQMANTHFVLSADVELYPSRGVVPMFLGMISRPQPALTRPNPKVFVLPIFEVASDAPPPSCKADLVRLYQSRRAVFFHKYVCPRCGFTPHLEEWLRQRPAAGRMRVFHVAKRHAPHHRWEPIYIGTQEEPPYDERLTWEGRQDKMSQMHALCLLHYDLDILDNAFLVHAPGIKRRNLSSYFSRRQHMVQNDQIHHQVVEFLNKRLGTSPNCV